MTRLTLRKIWASFQSEREYVTEYNRCWFNKDQHIRVAYMVYLKALWWWLLRKGV